MNLTFSDKLMYSTLHLECFKEEELISIGTGFFFNFRLPPYIKPITSIVTNKHIIAQADKIKIAFTLADELSNPIDNSIYNLEIPDFKNKLINHPDSEIDLCAIPINDILIHLSHIDKRVFFIPLDKSIIPKSLERENLSAVEDILMVGYPNGIWDEVNNKPIFRKGITATHPKFRYNGRKEFLIDASCFPGSSGSPVFIYNENGYVDKENNSYNMSSRLLFIGIMRGGHEYLAEGTESGSEKNIYTKIPNNLGVVINSYTLFDLELQVLNFVYRKYILD